MLHLVCGVGCGLVAMMSAQHADGRQFDPGHVYMQYSMCGCCVLVSAPRLCHCLMVVCRPGALLGQRHCRKHQWSSGRIHRCHRCDPGSIPG
jgi:hypothetical protein